MSETYQGWAIVEQMGHKTIAGFVREVQLAGVPMLRIDVPDGEKPIEQSSIATQFIHASTLYALTPTAEPIVRKVAARTRVEPPATWGVTSTRAIGSGDADDEALEPEDPEDDQPDKIVDELLVNHGLAGVLELLIQNYQDVPEPDCDRYVAILNEARDLVDQEGRWPEATAKADKADQRTQEATDGQLELPPAAPTLESLQAAGGEQITDDGIYF